MGMKKKVLSATLCAVMVGSLAAPAFTVQAADDTLVYWSMWESTEPQGQVIQEAVDAYTEQTGVKVDLQFKGRTGNRDLRTNVDVLSLSATPIPRTLEMAVTGIREMSTLASPPEDRLPVLTYVGA